MQLVSQNMPMEIQTIENSQESLILIQNGGASNQTGGPADYKTQKSYQGD